MLDGTPRLSRNGYPIYHYCGLASFAEAVVVPSVCCIKVDYAIPARAAALIGCAVATGVGAVLHTAQVRPGDSVVVIGCGGVGLSCLQGAVLAGAETIIAVDLNPKKQSVAEKMGATHFVSAQSDWLMEIRRMTNRHGADWVFEAVGIPSVQEHAFSAVRPGGTLVLVGLAPMGTATNFPSAEIARTEKRVIGSYYGSVHPRRDFPIFLEWYRKRKLKLDEMISREYRLDHINEAYADMLSGSIARGVIVFR
jgi:S-(hydroxymethyl)glutathione dehydrogenase/alcohol dehydrogenase